MMQVLPNECKCNPCKIQKMMYGESSISLDCIDVYSPKNRIKEKLGRIDQILREIMVILPEV